MRYAPLLACLVLVAPAAARAESYRVDAAASTVGFEVTHLFVSSAEGRFKVFEANVTLDDAQPSLSRVSALIDAASIDTANDKRDSHLRSADYFDVARFPSLTFESTEVAKVAQGRYRVGGQLTIHGVTKPVVLEVNSSPPQVGDEARLAVVTTTIQRKEFGITSGSGVVGQEVRIRFELRLLRLPTAKG